MSVAWYVWYGLRMGLSREQALTIPFGELCDLIAVEQIKVENAKRKKTKAEETEEFFALLEWE